MEISLSIIYCKHNTQKIGKGEYFLLEQENQRT
jgi:hypothetical protein